MSALPAPWAKGGFMAGSKDTVNLDALIPREDVSQKPASSSGGIPVSQLKIGEHYYGLLRKPHFQRETNDWNVDNVVSLIRSFRDGHLIPSVILWGAEGYMFVIDGAHRLSVFIAWVNDDYGDKITSLNYFNQHISKRQKEIAKQCRDRISGEGLAYADLTKLTMLSDRTPEQLRWSTNIVKAIETQWVVGDADVALQSFLDINQRAVQIEPTERYMIEQNKAPNVIAARAVVSSARGHQYWGKFGLQNIEVVTKKAELIYSAIFEPEDAKPHKDVELQPAGPAYTANGLRLALDLVNITNDVQMPPPKKAQDDKSSTKETRDIDTDGAKTAQYIERTWGVVKYIAGKDAASLSLHPAVYFWGATGNHRPSVFLAVVGLIKDMIANDELVKFTTHRAKFEEFLIGQSGIGKAILSKYGGWKKSVAPVKKMLRSILDGLAEGKSESQIETELSTLFSVPEPDSELQMSGDKWRETKSAARIRATLSSASRCAICKARLVIADASDDHDERRVDGGKSTLQNHQLTHHYCNSGFKEHFKQKGLLLPLISFSLAGA
jgi:Protein of unknown function DUF262